VKQKRRIKTAFLLISLLLPIIVSILACGFPGIVNTSLHETEISLDVQLTLNAERITAINAEETEQAMKETSVLAQITTVPSPTTHILPTETQAAATVTLEPPATPSTSAALEPIPIKDWSMYFWVPVSSGCQSTAELCWKLNDNHLEAQTSTGFASLISKQPIIIDPVWENPYLVFNHKRKIERSAYLELQLDDKWLKVRDYTKSRLDWSTEVIDLNQFRGKKMILRYIAEIGMDQRNAWLIQGVQVVPNYVP